MLENNTKSGFFMKSFYFYKRLKNSNENKNIIIGTSGKYFSDC
jgi:hypothetical protein